jgi:hypothetical protein
MLKKTGAVAIAAAGLMLAGSPAFAAPNSDFAWDNEWDNEWDDEDFIGESEQHDQLGLLNFSGDSDLLSNLSILCNNDVNVLAVPILQGNDTGQLCGNSDDDDD